MCERIEFGPSRNRYSLDKVLNFNQIIDIWSLEHLDEDLEKKLGYALK